MGNPALTVAVRRGEYIESRHQVHGVVVDAEGRRLHGWGDAERLTMARSAVKSIQLVPLLASGAAERFTVTDDEIALAASSHGAEPTHVDLVDAWLDRIGADRTDLECGPMTPLTASAATALHAAGITPGRIHNCCSGKHTGFLTVARHLDIDPRGYLAPDHRVQQLVTAALADVTGVDLSAQTPVIDGCGIPVFRFPLDRLALAMARLGTEGAHPAGEAIRRRIVAALPSRHHLVSGLGRPELRLAEIATEPVVLKGGAEGVFMAALPDRGLGLALKAEDGAPRAVAQALSAVLHHLGATPAAIAASGPLVNADGSVVGSVQVDELT